MIGVSSPAYSVRPFEEVLEEISQHFALWEILSDADHFLSDIAGLVKEAVETRNMKFQVHLPFSDINIAAFDLGTRKHAVNTICELLACADSLGIEVAVLHPGYILAMGYYDKPRVPKLTRESLELIHGQMSDLSVRVALENMPDQRFAICRYPAELLEMLTGLDEHFGICFDTGHANTNGCIDDFFPLVDRLANVHLHDNDGARDSHLPLGRGGINFSRVLAALSDYGGNYIIETRDLPSAVESKEFLAALPGA